MRQILLALFLLMFGVAQVGAAPAGLCRHSTAEAHASALSGDDEGEVAIASLEEAAADAKLKTLADKVAAGMAAGVLPEAPTLTSSGVFVRAQWLELAPTPLSGQALQPLLNPPLT